MMEAAGRLYLAHPVGLYKVAGFTLVAAWTVNLIVQTWTIGGVRLGALADPRAPEFIRLVGTIFSAGLAHGMVYAVFNGIAAAILMLMVAPGLDSRESDVPEAMRNAAPRLPAVVGATLLFFVAVAGLVSAGVACLGAVAAAGMIMGGGPGIISAVVHLLAGLGAVGVMILFAGAVFYLSLRCALYQQAAVFAKRGPLQALRYSLEITRDAAGVRFVDRYLPRGAIVLLSLVLLQGAVGTIGAVPSLAVGLLFRGVENPEDVSVLNPTGMPIALLIPLELFSVLLSAAVLPYSIAVFTLFYFDVVARREISSSS